MKRPTRILWVQGNQSEWLARICANQRRTADGDPLAHESVLVQRPGIDRWLAQVVAGHRGVAWDFRSIPQRKLWSELAQASLIGVDAMRFAQRSRLRFAIHAALSNLEDADLWAPLRPHTQEPARSLALSEIQAGVYLDYLDARPDLLQRWERGEDVQDWQAELWRALVQRGLGQRDGQPLLGPLAAQQEILAWLAQPSPEVTKTLHRVLGRRMHCFGWTQVPAGLVDLLVGLSAHLEVWIYQLVPSAGYLEDAQTEHPLVHRWGAAYRKCARSLEPWATAVDLQSVVVDPEQSYAGVHEPRDPAEVPDLARVQRSCAELNAAELSLRGDFSLQVHGCWGKLREVEALHDQIAGVLHEHPDWACEDIVVWVSELEIYAPWIDAVFGSVAPPGGPRLPYRIVHAYPRAPRGVEAALLAILDSFSERATRDALLDLMQLESIARRFGWDATPFDALMEGVDAAQIRWGQDALDRSRQGQPHEAAHAWLDGIDRWVLGEVYTRAAWGDGDAGVMSAGVAPLIVDSSLEPDALGQLALFAQRYFVHRQDCNSSKTLTQWVEKTRQILEQLVYTEEDSAGAMRLQRALVAVLDDERKSGAEPGLYDLRAWVSLTRTALSSHKEAAPWGRGGVTFGQLGCGRPVASRMVALLGMGQGQFPRTGGMHPWNRLTQAPLAHEPSSRDQDRAAVLESLLCARERWICLYSSHDEQGVELAPSSLIQDLCAFVDRHRRAGPSIVVQHPLHRHTPWGWQDPDPRARGYRLEEWLCAQAWNAPRSRPSIIEAPVPVHDHTEIDLKSLRRYLAHAHIEFLGAAVGARVLDDPEPGEGAEPGVLVALSRYSVGRRVIRARLTGQCFERLHAQLAAERQLPWGHAGRCALRVVWANSDAILEAVHRARQGPPQAPLRVAGSLASFDLPLRAEVVSDVGATRALVRVHLATLNAKRLLQGWLEHLFVCAMSPRQEIVETVVIGLDRKGPTLVRWPACEGEQARTRLRALVDIYRFGQRWPLPVFLETSLAYAAQRCAEQPHDKAMRTATQTFESSFGPVPAERERDWPSLRLWQGRDPLQDTRAREVFEQAWPPAWSAHRTDFAALSLEIWQEALTTMQKEAL